MATYESRRYNTPVPNATSIADGSVNNTEFQFINTLSSNAQTQITARVPLAGGTMTGDLNFGDNVDANFGAAADLKIYHDGSNSFVEDAGTGRLTLISNGAGIQFNAAGEQMADFIKDGAVELFHNNVKKAETASGGFTVTGAMAATTVTGDGSGLTALNGSNISSGTVADARISALTASKLTGALPAIDGSNLTDLPIIPSATTDIGSILPFMIKRSNSSSNTGSLTLSAGTEVTPSSYSSGNLIIADYDNSLSKNPAYIGGVYVLGTTKGSMGLGSDGPTQGSSTSKTGVWRVIDPLFAGSGVGGGGPGSYTYHFSIMGLMQRIS